MIVSTPKDWNIEERCSKCGVDLEEVDLKDHIEIHARSC